MPNPMRADREVTRGWHPDEQRWLERFREVLAADYAEVVNKALLFGSKARGDGTTASDIDVMVIVTDEAADAQESIADMADELVFSAECWRAAPCVLTEDRVRVDQGPQLGVRVPRSRRRRGDHAPMNTEMIAKRHWKWATNALKAANRDAASRDPQNAVSRAYYAMMHAANAALATKGLQAKTHTRNADLVQRAPGPTRRGRQAARARTRQGPATTHERGLRRVAGRLGKRGVRAVHGSHDVPDRNPDAAAAGRTARGRTGSSAAPAGRNRIERGAVRR